MIITAHGGALGTGRNSKLYFKSINRFKADAIEVDIWKLGDLLYLSHWPSVFAAEKKLTLRYAFEIVKKKDILINCDLKMGGIVQDVIALAKEVGVQDKLIFTGSVSLGDSKYIDCGQAWFNSVGIDYTKYNVKAIKERIESYNNPHFAGINVNYEDIDLDFINECKKVGLKLSVWRIDRKDVLKKYGKLIDGNITTNQPRKVRKYLEGGKISEDIKRLAVVGIGRMGEKHAHNIRTGVIGDSRLVAVCDIDSKKLTEFSNKYQVPAYLDLNEMLVKEKLDGVIIATPHYSHLEIARACVEKGINVLVEKPISVTTKEASEFIKVMEEHPNVMGAMMFNQRTNKLYRKAKKLIDNGAIGNIQRVNFIVTHWYRTQHYYNNGGWRASYEGEGGGTLINQCVHQLDILQWLVGMPKSVLAFCETKNRNISTENDVTAILKYDNFNCVFTASTHEVPGTNRLEIAGDKGKIIVEKYKIKYVLNEKSEGQINYLSKKDYGRGSDKRSITLRSYYGLSRLLHDSMYGQQSRIISNFVKALDNDDKYELVAKIEDGLKSLELINAMYQSSWLGKEVQLPLDKEEYANLLAQKIEEEKQNKKK